MINDYKNQLEDLIKNLAKNFNYEICNFNLLTNHSPLTIQIILKSIDERDISLDDCSKFNEPALSAIDSSNLIKCSYVMEYYLIMSQKEGEKLLLPEKLL